MRLLDTAKDPSARPYYPASVSNSSNVGYCVEREYTILNETEYQREFNQRHRAKDPKLAQMTLLSHDGTQEKVFLFRCADQPHRKLRVFSMVAENRSEELLPPSGHLFASQAQEWQSTATAKRMEVTNMSAVLSPQSWSNLSTTAEYQVSPMKLLKATEVTPAPATLANNTALNIL